MSTHLKTGVWLHDAAIRGKMYYVTIEANGDGLFIRPAGLGDKCSREGEGWPVMLEVFDGVPRLIVWADINQEDSTHEIPLDGAAESRRKEKASE